MAVGLALLWDLVGKRVRAGDPGDARIAADIETAGLLGVGTKIYDDADWEHYFTTVRELDIFFAYGSTWRGLNQTRLARLAAEPHARIRMFLPDPYQSSVVAQLASRFSRPPEQLVTLIEEAHRGFAQLAQGAPGRYFDPLLAWGHAVHLVPVRQHDHRCPLHASTRPSGCSDAGL